MYKHSEVPKGKDVLYLKVIKDLTHDRGSSDYTENFDISVGDITWVSKLNSPGIGDYSRSVFIEDNRYYINFDGDCFKEIPNPYTEKESKKEQKVWRFLTEEEAEKSEGIWSDIQKTQFGKQIPEEYWEECENKECIGLDMASFHHSKYTDKPLPKKETIAHEFKVGDIVETNALVETNKEREKHNMKGTVISVHPVHKYSIRVEWPDGEYCKYEPKELNYIAHSLIEEEAVKFSVGDVVQIKDYSIYFAQGFKAGIKIRGTIKTIRRGSGYSYSVMWEDSDVHFNYRREDLELWKGKPKSEEANIPERIRSVSVDAEGFAILKMGERYIYGFDPATEDEPKQKIHPDVSPMKSI